MPKKSSSKNKTKLSLISRARSASMALAGGTKKNNLSLISRARSASMALAGGTRRKRGGMKFPDQGLKIHFGPDSSIEYNQPDYKLNTTSSQNNITGSVWRPSYYSPGPPQWWRTIPSTNVPLTAKSGLGNTTVKGGRKLRGGGSVKMDIPDGGDMNLNLKTLKISPAAAAAKGSTTAANTSRLSCCPTCPKVDIKVPTATNTTSAADASALANAKATQNVTTVGASSSMGNRLTNLSNSVKGFFKGGAPMASDLNFSINKNTSLTSNFKPSPHVEKAVSDGSSPCCPACPKAPIVAKGGRRKKGGQLELINTALVPGTLLYMQNKYSKKNGFSRMLPKFGGKTRRRRK
jgi:type 1 fimbria pilin